MTGESSARDGDRAIREVAASADRDPVDAAARARIRERAATVREREVETAISKLDAQGDLSSAEREAVERLADRLVARLVAVPERGLDGADEETARAALELFG